MDKCGASAHFGLLIPTLERHSIKATIRDHLEVILDAFQA